MKFIRRILPHAVMVLAVMFMVLLVLNGFNPRMGFISSDISRKWLWAFCVLALINGIVTVIRDRRE